MKVIANHSIVTVACRTHSREHVLAAAKGKADLIINDYVMKIHRTEMSSSHSCYV